MSAEPERRHPLQPSDDLRHRPEPGGRMRDSLFWQMTLPGESLAFQIYLYVSGSGRAGYVVAVWGPGSEPLALEQRGGRVADADDFDDLALGDVRVRHRAPLTTAEVEVRAEAVQLELRFEGVHEAFSYHANPDGLPSWFATDRLEQTGHLSGELRLAHRVIPLDGHGHRDHSWGVRDWRVPQHWKWLVAYTKSGRALNGWLWIARGEWGFAGYVLRAGRPVPVERIEARTSYRDDLAQRRLDGVLIDVEGECTTLELEVFGLLDLPDEHSGTMVREGACRARIDGEAGAGQLETLWPLEYLRHFGPG